MTEALINSSREKQRLYKQAQINPDLLPQYKRYKNIFVKLLRDTKANYYKNKFENCSTNSKSTWKLINQVLKPNSKNKHELTIQINGDKTFNLNILANEFNNPFSSVAPNLARNIPIANADPLSYLPRLPTSFMFFDTDPEEVNKII